MKSVSLLISALLLAVLTSSPLIWSTPRVSAQVDSTVSMLTAAAVVRKCSVTTAPIDFGQYDPLQSHATAPLDAQATITVSCTKGALVNIGIDDGANATGAVRRMIGAATTYLTYELFLTSGRSLRWGSSFSDGLDAGVAPSRDPRTFTVYGRVPGGQDVPEGAFQDTVVVTVSF